MTQQQGSSTAAPSRLGTGDPPFELPPVMDIHSAALQVAEGEQAKDEYLVDVETHVVYIVRATSPETAVAKAVLHPIEPDDEVREIARDVHTCVDTGDEFEGCTHEEETE